jgi:HSP20 family molecular chaperone IbpA
MTEETKTMESEKQEVAAQEGSERTRECPCFVPRADIYETGDQIVVVADMPGVEASTIDITLEKNILTINGYAEMPVYEDYRLVHQEYEVGDYSRRFKVSDGVDQDEIEAVYKDGVLRLYLKKVGPAQAKKISVKMG